MNETAADPNDAAFGDIAPPGDDFPFVLLPPFKEEEILSVERQVRAAVGEGIQVLEERGFEDFRSRFMSERSSEEPSKGSSNEDLDEEAKEAATVRGDPRPYQIALYEHCKDNNSIVHLGTGQGKTLIALMCIRHFWEGLSTDQSGRSSASKQIFFLVPSVALAVQHTVTIRANLPNIKVATACHSTSTSEKARNALAKAQIVVATHGSAVDLLSHYGDIFHLGRVNLLILDECHYATGNHEYAQLMNNFYRRIPESERQPRIVGLTASPIINVKKNVTASHLNMLVSDLEQMLDAKIVCLLDMDAQARKSLKEMRQGIKEYLVNYNSRSTDFKPLPSHEPTRLHKARAKELNQLHNLYNELGPIITGTYCTTLAREISRSNYEGETEEEYYCMISHLKHLSSFCKEKCEEDQTYKGRTEKMVILETLLCKLLSDQVSSSESVGLVFVERRITAIALNAYFRRQLKGDSQSKIRCDCLVRQSHQVFKYLHYIHKLQSFPANHNGATNAMNAIKDAEKDWVHQTKQIRAVLDSLRKREINLLFATSVVEEGVDVPICSFVIVLDEIKTSKSYIQMKGRARQKNAKFYCFNDIHPGAKPPSVSLEDAADIEQSVKAFLEQRADGMASKEIVHKRHHYHSPSSVSMLLSEIEALRKGEYITSLAYTNLNSSKSLLNHYFQSIPMDIAARSSKKKMNTQLPIYKETNLILPAHLPPEIRVCVLPQEFNFLSKKKREEMLALMAVVRLHERNLINDRLLPLKKEDLHRIWLQKVLLQLPPPPTLANYYCQPNVVEGRTQVYLYPLFQTGNFFIQHNVRLHGRGRHLGVLSFSRLPDVPSFSFQHTELGVVSCDLGIEVQLCLNEMEFRCCTKFYSVLMNARWRRRTGRKYFTYAYEPNIVDRNNVIPKYIVVSLTEGGGLDLERMQKVVSEYHRGKKSRISAVMSASGSALRAKESTMVMENDDEVCAMNGNKSEPRLWAPIYSPNNTYISFSPSSLLCSASFPNEEYSTYSEYMLKENSFYVKPTCKLFAVQHLWTLPRQTNLLRDDGSQHKRQKMESFDSAVNRPLQEGEISPCSNLRPALLPQDACMEAPLADASLYLHCILLPQFLYQMERCLIASAFRSHCLAHFRKLGGYLDNVKLNNIVEALTAKSCTIEEFSYDRLEYLGDAVLKLLHTDTLLYSPVLSQWTSCLHEGDLSKLRSEMGCNERLKCAAESAGIDKFILTTPLARGMWVPNGFLSKIRKEDIESSSDLLAESDLIVLSTKVCADVVEALLGLVYIKFGYEAAGEVAGDLRISLNKIQKPTDPFPSVMAQLNEFSQQAVEIFLGGHKFRNPALVKEALTHPSCLYTDVPSYQKLEWVGDAVLCLVAREWVYKNYTELSVGNLVIIETTIVCNETLSNLAWRKGLQSLIRHADQSLPGRMENFVLSRHNEVGLWGSDPPKVLADVVEALIGASHVDGGFAVGQESTKQVIMPVLKALQSNTYTDGKIIKSNEGAMMHPKQVLYEMGNFFKIRVMTERSFSNRVLIPVWRQMAWRDALTNGDSFVCCISCHGIPIAALSEPSYRAARNRACSVISEIFRRFPDLLEKTRRISAQMAHLDG